MKLTFITTRVLDHYHYVNNNVIEQRNNKKKSEERSVLSHFQVCRPVDALCSYFLLIVSRITKLETQS